MATKGKAQKEAAHVIRLALLSLLLLAAEPLPPPPPTPAKPAQEPQEISASEQETGATNHRPTEEPAPTVNLLKAKDHERQAANQGNHQSNGTPPDWIVWFTGALALLALFQFVAMAVQAWLYRKTLRLEQRPWVVPTGGIDLSPDSGFPAGQERRLEVQIVNSGRSPALKMVVRALWSNSDPTHKPPESVPEIEMPISIIGPDRTQMSPLSPIPPEVFNQAWSGQSRFWLYGKIEYGDIFKRRRPYTTKFCFVLRPDVGRFIQRGPYNDCT